MKRIIALTDYKGHFGSKWKANPYRSGFDKNILAKTFKQYGIEIEYLRFQDVQIGTNDWNNQPVLYTSSEEFGLYYKSFIEDIVYALDTSGAQLIPGVQFLRANNNKVFMELMRDNYLGKELSGLKSKVYGTVEELNRKIEENKIDYPCVIKRSAGAMSRGVYLAKDRNDLLKYAKKTGNSSSLYRRLKEKLRKLKHAGYKPESQYQNKFIVQPFIPDLSNDWKVLIFGDHYYVLKRGIQENDFRASGSGYNYKAGSNADLPVHLLNWIKKIYETLNVPHLSMDVAYDGNRGYLFEFQAVYFGTATLEYCNDYYTYKDGAWVIKQQEMNQEEEYAWSVKYFLSRNNQDS